jgi:hypothetical protein
MAFCMKYPLFCMKCVFFITRPLPNKTHPAPSLKKRGVYAMLMLSGTRKGCPYKQLLTF